MAISFIVPIAFAGLFVLAVAFFRVNAARKKTAMLKNAFGTAPENDTASDVSEYHQVQTGRKPQNLSLIDKATWRDLNMQDVFWRICACQTRPGQEYLYHALHNINGDPRLIHWVDTLETNPEARFQLQKCLAHIGHSKFSLTPYFYKAKADTLPYPEWLYRLLTFFIISLAGFSILSFFLIPPVAPYIALGLLPAALVNIFIYYRTKLLLENALERLSDFGHVLYGCKKILKTTLPDSAEAMAELKTAVLTFRRIRGKFSRNAKSAMSEIAYIQEYLYMIFLVDINRFHRQVRFIEKNRDTFETIYRTVARIDAAISILSFRQSVPYFCRPEITKKKIIAFSNVCHPLIKDPVPNSGKIEINTLITGANATGKSTFIKTLAINHILGLSIDTCLAESFKIRRALVISAMAAADNILEGDSYYVAEIKALKRVLDAISTLPCACFIDEILRGTNAADRLSVTKAVLEHLIGHDSLCLFATHDTDLAKSFDQKYANYHFEETVSDTEVLFDYRLKPGVAAGRNAIRLLSLYDYPDSIIQSAKAAAKEANPQT